MKGLESKYTFGSNVSPLINFTLRGEPAPKVTWRLHKDDAGNAAREQSDSYTYEYSIQLPKLTQQTCGRQLVLKASGYNMIERTTTVFVTDCKYWHHIPDLLDESLNFRLSKFFIHTKLCGYCIFARLFENIRTFSVYLK